MAAIEGIAGSKHGNSRYREKDVERCPLCEVVTGCVDYGYSMTPINVAKKISPGSSKKQPSSQG